MHKECSNLKKLPKNFNWNLSEISELKSLSEMNVKQAKYCFDNNLLYEYPMIGMAAIIEGKIKKRFNNL